MHVAGGGHGLIGCPDRFATAGFQANDCRHGEKKLPHRFNVPRFWRVLRNRYGFQ